MFKSTTTSSMKGIHMSKSRKSLGALLALALLASPLALYTAQAATGGPRDSFITLQAPFLDAKTPGMQFQISRWPMVGLLRVGLVAD